MQYGADEYDCISNIETLQTRLRQTEERLTSETDSRKRVDAEVVAWKFKYEKAEQAKLYAYTTLDNAMFEKTQVEKIYLLDTKLSFNLLR